MHFQKLLAFSSVFLLGNVVGTLADLEADEVPPQCKQVCNPIIQRSQHCDKTTKDDHAEKECMCKLENASTVAPKCAACVTEHRNDVSDPEDRRDNDVYDIIKFCHFSTSNAMAATSSASPSSSAMASSVSWASPTSAPVSSSPVASPSTPAAAGSAAPTPSSGSGWGSGAGWGAGTGSDSGSGSGWDSGTGSGAGSGWGSDSNNGAGAGAGGAIPVAPSSSSLRPYPSNSASASAYPSASGSGSGSVGGSPSGSGSASTPAYTGGAANVMNAGNALGLSFVAVVALL